MAKINGRDELREQDVEELDCDEEKLDVHP